MMRSIKCPHCEHEFSLNVQSEVGRRKPVSIRFMGINKNVGPKPKYIQVTCKNKRCGRTFQVKV